MKKFGSALLAGALTVGIAAAPVSADDPPTIVETVLAVSGDSGFDSNPRDFDILRDALIATDLAAAVSAAEDITVFAPWDGAMVRLAKDLGYDGSDEAGAFGFIAQATGFQSAADPGLLDDVLLYHVSPGAKSVAEIKDTTIDTLLGQSVEVVHNRLVDGDDDDRDARIRFPRNIVAEEGVIHSINRVMRPIDLDAPAPDTIVDAVLAVSGDSGFDSTPRDFDILREALLATGLADAVATTDDITVFAPWDSAMIRLAKDLGYEGSDEAGTFAFLAEATGFVSADEPGLLDDVLLYHVSPGAKTVRDIRDSDSVETLLGADLGVSGNRLIDGDPNDRDGRIRFPRNVETGNGIIQSVNRVLRPIDL